MANKPDPAPRADSDWGKPAVEQPAPVSLVKVRCISHGLPWTDKKSLKAGEIAEISAELAEYMLKNKVVELVEEEKDK